MLTRADEIGDRSWSSPHPALTATNIHARGFTSCQS